MKKIMFNDKYGLTKAVLDEKKSQTRRFVPEEILNHFHELLIIDKECEEAGLATSGFKSFNEYCLYAMQFQKQCYKIGEEVAIAQCYADIAYCLPKDLNLKSEKGWHNKMFVRAELMPHRIKITKVRIERLQDISYDECEKEGIKKDPYFGDYHIDTNNIHLYSSTTPRKAFASLINQLYGKGTWDSNPLVIVYDFILVK